MNLFVSIFGGMTLTAVLYGLARLARLSNYWAASLAAGLPTLAYMVYALVTRPSLDVVTMHVIAYPTIAVLLYQLYANKGRGTAGMHWIPRLLVLFFVGLCAIYGAFVYISSQGLPPALAKLLLPDTGGGRVHTGFAGVVDHHEEAAKGIGQHLKQEHKLARLGWQVEVNGLNDPRAGQDSPVAVYLRDRQGQAVDGVKVSLDFSRPGQSGAASLQLTGTGHSGYQGRLPTLQAGTWVANLNLVGGGEHIRLEKTIQVR
jgi:nitrogen fixation protein FixH